MKHSPIVHAAWLIAVSMLIFALLTLGPSANVQGGATTKALSTNFTVVNLGTSPANVAVQYLQQSGIEWRAAPESTSFELAANGGQYIISQYFDDFLALTNGSAILQSDQPLGMVVQMLAVGQTPTSGAYVGTTDTGTTLFVPLGLRGVPSATGQTSYTQVTVQNAGSAWTIVTVNLVAAPNTGYYSYTLNQRWLAPGASTIFDLADEGGITMTCYRDPGSGGLDSWSWQNTNSVPADAPAIFNPVFTSGTPSPANWFGACRITSTANVVAMVQQRTTSTGSTIDEAGAYQAFSGGSSTVIVPLIAKRLPNGLATAVTIQNLSNLGTNVSLQYIPSGGGAPINVGPFFVAGYSSLIRNHRLSNIEASMPDGWVGSLIVTSTGQPINAYAQLTNLTPNGDTLMAVEAFTR